MSAPITRGQLKTRILQRFDAVNSQYVDTTPGGELEMLVDTELRKLWNMLTDLDESYTKRGPLYLSTSAGQRQYLMPSDFYKLTQIYYVPPATGQANYKFPIRQYTEHEYGSNAYFYNWGPPPIFYNIEGFRMIVFDPVPSVNQNQIVEYWYVPAYQCPASDTEILTNFVVPGWEDYIVDGVLIDLRIKEGSEDVQFIQARRDGFAQSLREIADNRDRFMPHRVQDVGWNESGSDFTSMYNQCGYYGTW